MSDPLFNLAAIALPLIALKDAGLSHYHLYKRLEPDPVARFCRALWRYVGSVFLALSAWFVCQTLVAVLFNITNPFLPAIIATVLVMLFNCYALKVPANWRDLPPLLSSDRSYHAFLQIVVDRAAEAQGKPDRRDAYLAWMYEDDQARMQAVGQYLAEHQDQDWITLTPAQLSYHPALFGFPVTAFYLIALLPILLPFMLAVFDPTITEQNFSLTMIASALGAVFYSPLFDPVMLPIITVLAVAIVLVLTLGSEFARLKFLVPGLAGLLVLAMFAVFIWHYIGSYVVERNDTPLLAVTNYLLEKLRQLAGLTGMIEELPQLAQDIIRAVVGSDRLETLRDIDALVHDLRGRVLAFQSRLGALFLLPALIYWGALSIAVLWELHFSQAAQVTFQNRMRKPMV